MDQPLIQLIVLPCNEYSLAELDVLAGEFSRVDLLTRQYQSSYSTITNKNLHVHVDLVESTVEQMINRSVDKESNFYFITGKPDKIEPGFAAKLRNRINDFAYVLLVKSDTLSGLLVNTHLGEQLCHFGEQPVDVKIDIWCKNWSHSDYVFDSMDDFFSREDVLRG